MPFKSEKQRRYLWLKHPDIAKRWADEYPNQKKLPMYSDKKEPEKQSAAQILNTALPNYLNGEKNPVINTCFSAQIKKSDSKQEYVKLPKTSGPTFAGETEAQAVEKPVEDGLNDKSEPTPAQKDQLTADALFKKLSVVLSPRLMQEIEDEQARQQARAANRMPQNVGIKRLPPVVNSIMPPMGMPQPAPNPGQTQPAQPAQPQQPANGQLASVGGGNSPNANPINSFGGLSTSGDINGNAALGTQNMAGGEKISAGNEALAYLMSMGNMDIPDPDELDYDERMKSATEKFSAVGLWDRIRAKRERGGKPAKPGDKDYPDAKSWKKVTAISEKQSEKKCSCGCGDTVTTCKCSASCSCRQKGGSCYKPEKTAASTPAWQRAAGKNDEGGLNAKGRASYNKATGGHLKAPVTESKPSGDRAKRQNSFCSRMCGMKKHETGAKTKSDPESRINKALRKWNCKCANCAGQKFAQEFDPALSRDAENAVMHGTGLIGSGALGTVAGIPVSAGLEHIVNQNNWMPDSDKHPWGHVLMQGLLRAPIVAGGMLGTRLYDNYILRPHMKREMERKQQEEAVRAQLMKKQAEASLQRVLGTALASTGGGLLLGSYPGWKLQRASEIAGNSDFTNFVAGKAPIALAGALSAGLYNHWLDRHEKKKTKKNPEQAAHPALQYMQYLVH